ncbi:MAG: hemolysin III family protein [Bacteroidetes bacterium]|nr:hemolysin III family protein [Bacteroidota bacterium]
MSNHKSIIRFSPPEEWANIITHGLGILLSVIAFFLLIQVSQLNGTIWHKVSFFIFGASLIGLYTSSTLYHSVKSKKLRIRFRILDHISIFILIAGSYTPFALVTMHGTIGWIVLCTIWGLAFAGILLKLFFTGRFVILSTIMYVLMGWMVVFTLKPLINNLPPQGINWLLAGGISYTAGALFFSIKKIKFNHAIFHIFVLAGSFCHFMSVFYYVLPRP